MNNVTKYKKIKKEYDNYVVIIKSGIFYVTYDNDALIMNYIFNYNIKDNKVGFPISIKENIIKSLNKENINVILEEYENIAKYEIDDKDRYYYVLEEASKIVNENNKVKDLINLIEIKLKQSKANYVLIKEFIDEL